MQTLALVLFLSTYLAAGANFLSNALGSNMVLQREPLRANIWGWSTRAGATVQVTLNGNTIGSVNAGADGKWLFTLPAHPAGGPHVISVSSNNGEKATIENVLFGDVFLCGGQSNMQMTVDQVFNADEEVKKAANYPDIRVFTVGTATTSATPLPEFATILQHWVPASPKSIGSGNWTAFSAACWFFGKNLYDKHHVPLGLFSDNWGGTIVQAWSSPEALAKCPAGAPGGDPIAADPNLPSVLWNAMIVPVLDMTILGVTWYQGESNAIPPFDQPNYYACAFPAMIEDWRKNWKLSFGFYYVQLAPWIWDNLQSESLLRLSQLYANKLPMVGFATAMDLGDPTSPFGSIHPQDKQTVGKRLADAAFALTYKENVPYLGPQAESWKDLGIVGGKLVAEVTFEAATVGGGLVNKPASCSSHVNINQCAGYQLQLADGSFVVATGVISGKDTVRVEGTGLAPQKLMGVRYGFANYPVATLHNLEGFPAIPFAFPNPIKPTL